MTGSGNAQWLRRVAADARTDPGANGTIRITVWHAERIADELDRLHAEQAEQPDPQQQLLLDTPQDVGST